jgi:hypothetical protein
LAEERGLCCIVRPCLKEPKALVYDFYFHLIFSDWGWSQITLQIREVLYFIYIFIICLFVHILIFAPKENIMLTVLYLACCFSHCSINSQCRKFWIRKCAQNTVIASVSICQKLWSSSNLSF